jgi:RimJ/RimL family protein N-acetyltransferase
MELRDLREDDLDLYRAILCDPAMMEHLGGPHPADYVEPKLRRDVAAVRADTYWVLVIVPDVEGSDAGVGTVSLWKHEMDGEVVSEIGWMVVPGSQGRGLGSAAVREVLDRARADGRWGVVHAYPPVSNERSNAMCRRMGFTYLDTRDFEYHGHPLSCNDWAIDLGQAGTSR